MIGAVICSDIDVFATFSLLLLRWRCFKYYKALEGARVYEH